MNSHIANGAGRRRLILAAVAALAVATLAFGLYRLGVTRGMKLAAMAPASTGSSATAPTKPGDIDPRTGRRVLYWHDPMVPNQRFEAPGPSPFMNMALVPVYESGSGAQGAVVVSAGIRQNLGLRTAEVVRATLAPRIDATGTIAFNERDQVIVQSRATAYVERLHVRATLDSVDAGQPLAELFMPDWVAAQEEFLSVSRMRGSGLESLIDAARQRMRQLGMTDAHIRDVEARGAAQPRITLRAPIAGVVVELAAREGMTVEPGETLLRIHGLSSVWVNAEVPESQAALLRPGAAAEARSPAVPNTVFRGVVQTILPSVDMGTRTIRARIELANPERTLVPGMFVSVAVSGPASAALMVPTEAVIRTGTRTVVMLAEGDGTFRPVDVEIGIESNGQTAIERGLSAGQRVVVSGQFLLDSEASLRATGARMQGASATDSAAVEHSGEGQVEALDADSVTLSHGPIPSLDWPSMTMRFQVPDAAMSATLDVGQTVRFGFVMEDNDTPRITRLEPVTAGAR